MLCMSDVKLLCTGYKEKCWFLYDFCGELELAANFIVQLLRLHINDSKPAIFLIRILDIGA